MTPRSPAAILTDAAGLLEDEARCIFESNTSFTTEHIVWDPEADSLRERHARLLEVAAELRVMEAYRMAVDTNPRDKDGVWWAGGDTAQAYGDTPSLAIIACAEALEECA